LNVGPELNLGKRESINFMLSRSARQQNFIAPPITACEQGAQKSIGALEALLLSVGFTTSNFLHVLTPVAQGGLGLAVTSLSAAIASISVVGLSTIIITALIFGSLCNVFKEKEYDLQTLINKQHALKEKQFELLARLFYIYHLLKKMDVDQPEESKPYLIWPRSCSIFPKLKTTLQTSLYLDEEKAGMLAKKIEQIYQSEEEKIIPIMNQSLAVAEEKAIKDYLQRNHERFSMDDIFLNFYEPNLHTKSWRPVIAGFFAGFISFMNMSSGFLGTYSSLIALASTVGAISLAIPFLGWAFFGASILFALGIGLAVRHFTSKHAKRQAVMNDLQEEYVKLTNALANLHDPEIIILNQKRLLAEKRAEIAESALEAKCREDSRSLLKRSLSCSSLLFVQQPKVRFLKSDTVSSQDQLRYHLQRH
jgi:hypothetical protein